MKRTRPGPLVIVHWRDIRSDAAWVDNPAEIEPLDCIDVGWLVHKCRSKVVLVRGLCAPGTPNSVVGDSTVIPRGCVTKITRIAEKP